MPNPNYFAETAQEYNDAARMARQVGVQTGQLLGQYDPEARLNIVFYNNPVKNERKSKLGYHHVFAEGLLGPDGKMVAGSQLFEDEAKTIPVIADCDCEEENVLRQRRGVMSTLPRVIRERTQQGVHITPGRPIYEDKIFVKVLIPGNTQNEVDSEAIIVGDDQVPDTMPAAPEIAHNHKYPRAWANYKSRQNKKQDGAAMFGTPLSVLAQEGVAILKPSQVEAFKHANIRTVEHLLSVPDSTSQHLVMGFSTIKKSVQAWADKQAGMAPAMLYQELQSKSEAENAALRSELEELKGLVRSLQPLANAKAAELVQAQQIGGSVLAQRIAPKGKKGEE